MSKLDHVETVDTIFLNGERLIKPDYIGQGEVEDYGVRFKLFGSGQIAAVELLYESPDPVSCNIKDVVEVIGSHVRFPFAKRLAVYVDIDEERYLDIFRL